MTADTQHMEGIDLDDPKVFTSLWHKTQPHLLAMAHQILGQGHVAEDIASDSYVKLWRGVRGDIKKEENGERGQEADKKLKFESELAAIQWLRVTTRNGCFKELQKREGQGKKLQEIGERLRQEIQEEWTIDDLQAQQLQLLYAEVRQLPPRARQVFEMKYMKAMGNDAIASELGLSYQTVSDHLARAMKMLRGALKDRPDLLLVLIGICGADSGLIA